MTDIRAIHPKRLLVKALAPVAITTVAALTLVHGTSGQPTVAPPAVHLGPEGLQRAAFNGNVRIFLRLDGVTQPPSGAGHANDLAIDSMSFGVSRAVTQGPDGQEAGKPEVAQMALQKKADRWSVDLMTQTLAGAAHNATVFVERVDSSGKVAESLTYALTSAMLTGVSEQSPAGGPATENLSLVFASMKIRYANGPSGAPATVSRNLGWDVLENQPSDG